jgi:VacB and RNase II family 3'-5' exoribonuclease
MKKELIEYVESDKFESISFNGIKKYLGLSKKHMNEELKEVLNSLELEGLLYEDKDGLYKKMPSNFLVTTIDETKKGTKYYETNNIRCILQKNKLNGALCYDKVIIDTNTNEVVKVLVRNMPNVVCEVRMTPEGFKYLYPVNTNNNLKITIGTQKMKKLIPGSRVLIEATNEIYDNMYVGKYIKTIGFINEPDIDFKTIAYNYGFNLEFPKEVLEELKKFSDEVTYEDKIGRVDLTDERVFTIDGKDCKDMDDAISIKRKEDGGYILKVHIAHVSHYVKFGSAIFEEAARRGNSVYFPDSVVAMLPERLSNELCSLNPNVERLTRTVEIELDKNAKVTSYKTYRSVIKSKLKMNYDDVFDIITGKEAKSEYKPFVNDLMILKELSEKLTKIKIERGYTSFDSEELKFVMDELGNTKEILVEKDNIAHEIIENCMLLPNELVTHLYPGFPFGFRNHEIPSAYKMYDLIETLKELGYPIKNLKNMKPNFLIQRLLNDFKGKEEYVIISRIILTSLKLAYYGTENKGHFGLALQNGYTHYTSPIRRLNDLIIHNLLDMYEDGNLTKEKLIEIDNMIEKLLEHASRMERQAEKAEYEADKLQVINYLKQHIGEEQIAYIEKITPEYIKVMVPGLMDGIIKFDDMPERTYMLPSGKLKGVDTGRVYKPGHKVLLTIKDATYVDKSIYYNLIDNLTLTESDSNKLTRKL